MLVYVLCLRLIELAPLPNVANSLGRQWPMEGPVGEGWDEKQRDSIFIPILLNEVDVESFTSQALNDSINGGVCSAVRYHAYKQPVVCGCSLTGCSL